MLSPSPVTGVRNDSQGGSKSRIRSWALRRVTNPRPHGPQTKGSAGSLPPPHEGFLTLLTLSWIWIFYLHLSNDSPNPGVSRIELQPVCLAIICCCCRDHARHRPKRTQLSPYPTGEVRWTNERPSRSSLEFPGQFLFYFGILSEEIQCTATQLMHHLGLQITRLTSVHRPESRHRVLQTAN